MCIITVIPTGIQLYDEETFFNCARSNPDGFGLMYVDEQDNVIVKKTMNVNKFFTLLQKTHQEYNKTTPIVAHFRVGTCGERSTYNCHPFEVIKNKLAFAHNGQIFRVEPTDKKSDSHFFAFYLQQFKQGFHRNPAIVELVTKFVDPDILVFLDDTRNLLYINKQKGTEEEGIWYSNFGFRNWAVKKKTKCTVMSKCEYCRQYEDDTKMVNVTWNEDQETQHLTTMQLCQTCIMEMHEKENIQFWYQDKILNLESLEKTISLIVGKIKHFLIAT